MKNNERFEDALNRRLQEIKTECEHLVKAKIDKLLEQVSECNHCGSPTIGERGRRRKFCSDICRTNFGRKKKK